MIDFDDLRAATGRRISAWGLEPPAALPLLGDGDFAWIRPVDDVIARCHAIAAIVAVAQDADANDVRAEMEEHDLVRWLAERERLLLDARTGAAGDTASAEAVRQAGIDATWRQEALWALLWAIRFVDDLPPDEDCGDTGPYERLAPDMDPAQTVDGVVLRPVDELARMVDLYYVLHWHDRNAQFGTPELPEPIKPGVVWERRTALEWLLQDQDWDEVDTST